MLHNDLSCLDCVTLIIVFASFHVMHSNTLHNNSPPAQTPSSACRGARFAGPPLDKVEVACRVSPFLWPV